MLLLLPIHLEARHVPERHAEQSAFVRGVLVILGVLLVLGVLGASRTRSSSR